MSSSKGPKQYDPKAAETRLYQHWERAGLFHAEPDPARPPFIICMPPPNVTGRAHLGHGSTYTAMDVLVRYHRMLGDNADWLPGLDHAAIATEAVLVKELATEGLTRESLGRKKYLERAWRWAQTYGGEIDQQFRKLGFSPDWQRARFTMDDALSVAVRKVFVQLYREGAIYRGKRLVNWDLKAQTTISDAEVEHEERDGFLWRVKYPLTHDASEGIVVATTRPETMLGDVAIAVHPKDKRYEHFVGRSASVPPLLEREIPIIADAAVEPEFGTGAVKVTPGHDPLDYEIGERHGLSAPSVISLDGTISGADMNVGPYAGLDRFEARKRIIADLRERGFIVAEEPYRYAIAVSERTGEVIEPLLLEQWFARMKPLAQPALQAYRDGSLKFIPERHGRVYEHGLENIRDWNISRQVWWGHQLPVWYTPAGDIVVAETPEEAADLSERQHGTRDLTRDPDTLDTWFSSALWPFSILGWPEQTTELACWYPSQVMITGWEIIFLWVTRMVMLGIHFLGKPPFPEVFVAPLVFDARGRKMSKSLGNAIDPLDLVERYGADAFRLGILRQMRLEGQEVRFQESRCEEARNFNNKLWNAARYVLTLPEGLPSAMSLPARDALTLADRWILTRLHDTIVEVSHLLDRCDFGIASETLWRFVWYEYCDWYLEATKAECERATRGAVLSYALNAIVRLLHPIVPFITEEVWLSLPHDGATIVTAAWPDADEVPADPVALATFGALQSTAERLRNLRAEIGLTPAQPLTLRIPQDVPDEIASLLELYARGSAERTAALGSTLCEAVEAVTAEAPSGVLLERYRKDLDRLRAEVERGEKKLANHGFVVNARPEIVSAEREKLDRYRAEMERVQLALAALE